MDMKNTPALPLNETYAERAAAGWNNPAALRARLAELGQPKYADMHTALTHALAQMEGYGAEVWAIAEARAVLSANPLPADPVREALVKAVSQARFCLRELLLNDADAKMTVAMLDAALGGAA